MTISVPLSPPQSYASFQCRSLFRSIRLVDRRLGRTTVLLRTMGSLEFCIWLDPLIPVTDLFCCLE